MFFFGPGADVKRVGAGSAVFRLFVSCFCDSFQDGLDYVVRGIESGLIRAIAVARGVAFQRVFVGCRPCYFYNLSLRTACGILAWRVCVRLHSDGFGDADFCFQRVGSVQGRLWR